MKKSMWLTVLGIFILVIAVYAGIKYSDIYPSTDDAYVQANIVNIAAQISGPVQTVSVKDHQKVSEGQLLFTIDPAPFEIAVQQAQANVAQAQAEFNRQNKDTTRILQLVKEGHLSKAAGDDAQGSLEQLAAALKVAQAACAQAQLNLQYTKIISPANGFITNFTLRKGQMLSAGSPLFALVENKEWWVDANFKETDLTRIKIGQPATITTDLYPKHPFKGQVEGISAGSGAAFSLLPPENATGNWVKVTQRFPVRISLKNINPRYPLRFGASSTVTVDTRG